MTRRIAGHHTRALQTRSMYARTNGNMLVNTGINPSDQPPVIWWHGSDQPWGPIGPNGPWSHGEAAALPAVIRATSLITGPLTSAPFRVIDLADGHPLGRPRWILDPMTLRVDARFVSDVYPEVSQLPRGTFYASWLRQAIWWGESAFICQEDETGQPLAGSMRLVSSHLLSTERNDQGVLCWALGAQDAADEKAVFDRDGYLSLGPVRYRVIVLRNPHSDVSVDGRSAGVFAMSPETFKLSGQIESYAAGQFRSGIPNGVLKVHQPGLTETQATELKTAWMAAHGNDRRSIGVLNAVTDFVPFNLSPVDAALGEVTRLSIASIAMAFAMDPEILGTSLSNSATYKNAQEYWSRHRDFGLSQWIAAVQDTLSALLPGTQGVVVDLDRFANPPLSERVETGRVAVEAGLMTVQEWRALEGMQPLTESDSPEQARSLSAAETSQKVYLAVAAGVLSVQEARQMIVDAGGNLDVDAVPAVAEPTPEPQPEADATVRSVVPKWRR